MITVRTVVICAALVILLVLLSNTRASARNRSAPASPSAAGVRSGVGPEGDALLQESNQKDRSGTDPRPIAESTGQYLSGPEFVLSSIVAIIGLMTFAVEFFLLRRIPNLRPDDIIRVFAVTLVLIGTLLFVTAGFDTNSIAPAIGLFGTVAGYLLGRSVRDGGKSDEAKN